MCRPGLMHAVFVRMFRLLGLWRLTAVSIYIKPQFVRLHEFVHLKYCTKHLRAWTALGARGFIIPQGTVSGEDQIYQDRATYIYHIYFLAHRGPLGKGVH